MAMPDLRALRLIAPAVRSRAASLAGAAALLVAYSAVAVSPASIITQQLIDRGLAAGDVTPVAVLACALVAAAAAGSALSVLAARTLAAAGEALAADLRADLVHRTLNASAGWMSGRDDGYVAARIAEASGVSALFSKTSFTFASSRAPGDGLGHRRCCDEPCRARPCAPPRFPAYAWCAARSLRAYRVSVAAALEANAGLTGRVCRGGLRPRGG